MHWYFVIQVYTINITCQTHTNSWTVRRRYSEFREVREKLLKSEGKSGRVKWMCLKLRPILHNTLYKTPVHNNEEPFLFYHHIITNIHLLSVRNINFPCKTYLKSNVSLDILEERKNSLEAFLESILRIIRLENNVELKTFLSVVSTPANNKQGVSQLLKVQPSYEVKFHLTKIQ